MGGGEGFFLKHPVILTDMLGYERYSVSNGTFSLGIICLDFAENELSL